MPKSMEDLFKTAVDTLEEQVYAPVVLAKLAERGYTPENDEEKAELLKVATMIRDGIVSGEIAPVPMTALEEDGNLSKQASEKVETDPMAFAPEITVKTEELEDSVKQAAAVLAWGALVSEKERAESE